MSTCLCGETVGAMAWEPESQFEYDASHSDYNLFACNTRKDKDKRICQHSFGVFFGCWPCGVVTMFNELFGSEGVRQVYALVIEWLASSDDTEREKIKYEQYI